MNHLVKEALVHVDRDELEEVLVEQRKNLARLKIISEHNKYWKNLIPHVLLHLCLNSSMASHFQEASLPLVEVIE